LDWKGKLIAVSGVAKKEQAIERHVQRREFTVVSK
jgi:hypothetical protein